MQNQFDALSYRLKRIADTVGRCSWTHSGVMSMTPDERRAWQDNFRRDFANALGGLAGWQRPPLDAAVQAIEQLDGYRRETVSFTTRPGLRALGYFLVPDDCPVSRPAVLCLPGHGRGVGLILGMAEDGTQRPLGQPGEYAADFALECVARGHPAFALELIGFGERCAADVRAGGGAGPVSCAHDSAAALMLGETLAGWRVWEAACALDYLQTRADCVDPDRLAVMGISGGGLGALFLAALDPRVSVAVVSAYFNTFAASVLAVDHCIDNYVPGLLRLCEMPDLAALVAPRALFVESGRDDPIFPFAGFEQAVALAREVYAGFGVPNRFAAEAFEGGHRFDGRAAFAFLEDALPI